MNSGQATTVTTTVSFVYNITRITQSIVLLYTSRTVLENSINYCIQTPEGQALLKHHVTVTVTSKILTRITSISDLPRARYVIVEYCGSLLWLRQLNV